MKILVTGAAGYFGSVLVPSLLRRGHDVRGVDALMFGGGGIERLAANDRFELVRADVRHPLAQALEGVDAVVHLAALVGHAICDKDPDATREINHLAARHLLASARDAGVTRFLFASTCSNYGVTPTGTIADEDTPLKPTSLYAETKVAAEGDTLAARSATFHPTIFRFATLFGMSPRMRFDLLLNELVRDAWSSRAIILHGADTWRPFLHVEDASAAVNVWAETPAAVTSGAVFNVAGENVRKRDVGALLQAELPDLRVSAAAMEHDVRDYRVSVEKARRLLGWSASRSTRDGVREILEALAGGAIPDPGGAQYTNLEPRL